MQRKYTYPSDDELVRLMSEQRSFAGVAREAGVPRGALNHYLKVRPDLKARMYAHSRRNPSEEECQQRAERKREQNRQWQRDNRDKARAANKRWREVHPEQARQASEEWYRRPEAQEWRRLWRIRNRELLNERERSRAKDPEYVRQWNRRNRAHRAGAKTDSESREYSEMLQGEPCVYCGKPAATVDHIVAIACGGSGTAENLAAACHSCNAGKGKKSLLEFLLYRRDVAGG